MEPGSGYVRKDEPAAPETAEKPKQQAPEIAGKPKQQAPEIVEKPKQQAMEIAEKANQQARSSSSGPVIWETVLSIVCQAGRRLLTLAFQSGIIKDSAQNDKSACNLKNAGNFAKKEYGEQSGNHRLAQFRGRDKGGRQKFQTPAENIVSQDRGKYSQQQPHNNAAGSVSGQRAALEQGDKHQRDCGKQIHNKGINGGGGGCPRYTSNQSVNSNHDGGKQGQKVSVKMVSL